MADYFVQAGVAAVAVHSGPTSAPRATAVEALKDGKIAVIFAVDMFNEGLDIPDIDTVLMLRPTESVVLWQQQFGRGLRVSATKKALTVIDYIGNHRTFLVKVRALLEPLLGTDDKDAAIWSALRSIQEQRAELPPGCAVTYDLQAIDILAKLIRRSTDESVVLGYYRSFRERQGERPTAVEMFHAGYNPRSVRRQFGSWFEFVAKQGDLTAADAQVLRHSGDFLKEVETTEMTKSFKMVTLLAMLNRHSFPGSIAMDDLADEFRRVASRSERLRADVGSALNDKAALHKLILDNPVAAWTEGRGTGNKPYFHYDGTEFRSLAGVPREYESGFQELLRELIDWRLAEYLQRGSLKLSSDIVCKVIHAGGRPIIKLPSRNSNSGIPDGWAEVMVDDRIYFANFAKEFVNVIRPDRNEEQNDLPNLLKAWFGSDAGLPGTRFQVKFTTENGNLRLLPVQPLAVRENVLTPWNQYMREEIPRQFGWEFSMGTWNQGFVQIDRHVFLLVTLDKGGLNRDHRYDDRFLSPSKFAWQSQNKTSQGSKHGQIIHDHRALGFDVHLFVRRSKLVDGKGAPFVYCGQVDFHNWEGERPIAVEWNLRESVPERLQAQLQVPADR